SGSGTQVGTPAGTYSQTATYDGTSLPGLVCETPEYSGVAHTWGGTISQTLVANQSFNGRGGLVALTSSITLQGCARSAFDSGSEPAVETDYFAQTPPRSPDGMIQIVLAGSTLKWNDILGNTQTLSTTYGSGGLIVAELPLLSGRAWTSAAARTTTRASSDNTTLGPVSNETLTVNADGSYTDASLETGDTLYPYRSVTTLENSDASGSITGVTQVEGSSTPGPPYGETLSAPSNNAVLVSPFGQAPPDPVLPTATPCPTPGGTPCPAVTATPYPQYAWYPYVPSAAHPFETIASADKGNAALPAGCSTSSAFPKSAELIETVDTTLDIWSGTTVSTTDAYVDPNDGVLCANVTVRRDYYALGPTSADATPAGTSTLTFTDSLQSKGGAGAVFAVPALARYLSLWR
ncbi:MAG TPA: hypothetical protein VFL13_00055, partial [Candidatus Baltobacteraceae bacterium]|nr:hypothetical protein [Candidatus Baltobacteraceae bacterium]